MVTNPHRVQSGESEISYSPGLQDLAHAICNTPSQAPSDCIQYILHLLWISQGLSRHHLHAPIYLCQEVSKITQGYAQLVLTQNEANFTEEAKLHFVVQFGDIIYGTLYVMADKQRPAYPALSAPGAHLLAQVCGWLFCALEQSLFLQGQCQRLDRQADGLLTRRELEILKLICWGYGQKEVAEKLCISPNTISKHLQHIYAQLGVHNERDVLFAAYKLGLFSILEQPSFF